MQHLGNDFSTITYANLVPHIELINGYHLANIEWSTETEFNTASFNFYGKNLDLAIGRDVYYINYSIHRYNSIFSELKPDISGTIRVDDLLLLNLMIKLLPKKNS